jgi:hypothetical protein
MSGSESPKFKFQTSKKIQMPSIKDRAIGRGFMAKSGPGFIHPTTLLHLRPVMF